jgi:Fur family transcriptional regulator, zinc uptake regulator
MLLYNIACGAYAAKEQIVETQYDADPTFPPADHDHRQCVADLLTRAERQCGERNVRLTPQRRRVLELVAASHAAVGAYEILGRVRQDGRPPAPISVYRALDFLIEQGFVHRVESLNAYIACLRTSGQHRPQFLVCRTCKTVAELASPAIDAAIEAHAEAAGFEVAVPVVEIAGLCDSCCRRNRHARAH